MIVWLSAGAGASILKAMYVPGKANYLGSFFDVNSSRIKLVDPVNMNFFLDSGAYSAWSRSTCIDLDEYIAFIKHHSSIIDLCAALDIIPGRPGVSAGVVQKNAAAEQSWQNYLYMQREGVQAIPVYHYGEHVSHLERLIAHGCGYIGIGGLVGVPGAMRRQWLDRVFAKLCDADGVPIVKTHAFGMTSAPLMFRYPWYSVDSTTWIQVAGNGGIYLPAMEQGKFVFDRVPKVVPVSSRNPDQSVEGKGSNNMPPYMREILDAWLLHCKQTYEAVAGNYYPRAVCNVHFFKECSAAKVEARFKRTVPTTDSLW